MLEGMILVFSTFLRTYPNLETALSEGGPSA